MSPGPHERMAGPTEPPHDADEALRNIWQILAALCLSPQEYRVMRMLFVNNYPRREVARRMGISLSTVRKYRYTAITKIKKLSTLFSSY